MPLYTLQGWQRPCYLMDDGYVDTWKELLETTDWDKFGRGKDPRCDNCMAHCGYEPTAVLATMDSLRQSLRAWRADCPGSASARAAKSGLAGKCVDLSVGDPQ